MKTCSTCKEEKDFSLFHKNKYNVDGYQYRCKECCASHYGKTKQTVIARTKQWYIANKDKKKAYDKLRREKIGDQLNQYDKERSSLPHRKAMHNRLTAKRRAIMKNASVKWSTELTDLVLEEAYLLAQQRKIATDIDWHVDHIIPLQGKEVCGLHVWNNFQVIPASENILKSNHFERRV